MDTKNIFEKDVLTIAPSKFNIVHLGVLSKPRNPSNLWKALDEIKTK